MVEIKFPDFIHGNVLKFLFTNCTYFHNFQSQTFPKFLSPYFVDVIEKNDNGCKSFITLEIIFLLP